jgi:hypothetical protein
MIHAKPVNPAVMADVLYLFGDTNTDRMLSDYPLDVPDPHVESNPHVELDSEGNLVLDSSGEGPIFSIGQQVVDRDAFSEEILKFEIGEIGISVSLKIMIVNDYTLVDGVWRVQTVINDPVFGRQVFMYDEDNLRAYADVLLYNDRHHGSFLPHHI